MLTPRPKPKLKPSLPPIPAQVTSASGQVFSPGDIIEIVDPFGKFVAAKITNFYGDASGQIWATFWPLGVKKSDYVWERGCIRQEALKRPDF